MGEPGTKDRKNFRKNIKPETIKKALHYESDVGIFGHTSVEVIVEKRGDDQAGHWLGMGDRKFVQNKTFTTHRPAVWPAQISIGAIMNSKECAGNDYFCKVIKANMVSFKGKKYVNENYGQDPVNWCEVCHLALRSRERIACVSIARTFRARFPHFPRKSLSLA
jgi:hypothetical protein